MNSHKVSYQTRRHPLLTLGLILLLLLAGCAAPAAPDSAPSPAPTPLTVDHALGETEIPTTPQRIVALEWTYVEDLLALGIQPVGVADIAGYEEWVQIPVELAPDVTDVGTRQAPNLETIAGLNPDLIVAPAFRIADIYEQLSEIAPTLAFDAYPTDPEQTQYEEMRQTFLTLADVVNRRAAGEAVLAEMEDTFTAARQAIEAAGLLGEPFVLAQAFGQDTVQVRLFTENALAVQMVEQIGLENAWEDATFQQYGFSTVSVEALPDLGDVHFFYVVQEENNVFAREAVRPVWESLPFVQNGHAYPLGGDTWLFGGPLSAQVLVHAILDALGLALPAETAFPVTIEHKFGTTTIPQAPQRVLSLGYNDQDPILALGVVPVAVRYWFGDPGDQIWPWAEEALGDARPAILNMPFGELNFEAIAALQPDLIIAVSAGIDEEEYALLSQIAPTVAQSDAYVNFGTPWQEQTRLIGRALGKEALANRLVAEMEARFAQAREAHPEFVGATAAIASPAGEGQFFFSGPQHERQRVLTSLGFVLPEELAQIAGDSFYGTISGERLDLLDTDVLIWTVSSPEQRAAIESNPLYQQLAVAREGRHIFLDTSGSGELVGPALVFSSVLSLPLVFDELVPMLAERLQR
ncbi:iron-siderophore ABC transporter substrate-binding protein [Litorilinea aerophila]|nr:iron-siderophore ABC transporter substrate-binding protein [Litorilinea aerophila]MCC9076510.1 iron-siderophore ABC transporter substrate-binding protein [Litorilinea aerophila]